jgi:hypothetical protein
MAAPKKKREKKGPSVQPGDPQKKSKPSSREKREPAKPTEKKRFLKIFGRRKKGEKKIEAPKLEVSKAKPPRPVGRRVVKAAPAPVKVEVPPPALAKLEVPPPAPAPTEEVRPAPAPVQPPVAEPKEVYIDRGMPLPQIYGEDKITAMAKDPNWLFAYWELTGPRRIEVEQQLGRETVEKSAWVLRVYDLSLARWSDSRIDVNAGNWYIPVSEDRKFRVEIGIVTQEGKFIPFASSKELQTPRSGPSPVVSEKWMVSDETFKKFLELSYPVGASGLSPTELAKRVREAAGHIRHTHR